MKRSILSLCLIFFSSHSHALSLQETIKTAFDNNPITEANDLRLDAEKWDVRAVKLDRLPSGYVSYSEALNRYQSTYGGFTSENDSRSRGWSVGASVRLYDGGVGKNRVCSAKKSLEASIATNNATNDLIPDTLGSLANQVFDVYLAIVAVDSEINFSHEQQKIYQILLKFAKNQDHKNQIMASLEEIDNNIEDKIFSGKRQVFKYETELVKTPVPPRLSTLLEVAESLVIPKTIGEAVEMGLQKNPEIVIAQAYLEAERCSLKAQKAQAFSPKVDLSVSRGSYHNEGLGSSSSIGNSVNLSLSIPLSPSSIASVKGSSLRLDAREMDLVKQTDRLKNSITGSLYPELTQYEKQIKNYHNMTMNNEKLLQELLVKVQNNEVVDYEYARSLLNRREYLYWRSSESLRNYVNTKFNIQRKIGTLFDYIDPDKKPLKQLY